MMYSLGYSRDLLLSLRWAGLPLTPCVRVLINSLITTRVRTRGCRGGRRRPASSYTDIEGTGVAIIFGNRTVLPSLHRQQPEYLQQALNVTPARVLAHVRPQRHADQPKKNSSAALSMSGVVLKQRSCPNMHLQLLYHFLLKHRYIYIYVYIYWTVLVSGWQCTMSTVSSPAEKSYQKIKFFFNKLIARKRCHSWVAHVVERQTDADEESMFWFEMLWTLRISRYVRNGWFQSIERLQIHVIHLRPWSWCQRHMPGRNSL